MTIRSLTCSLFAALALGVAGCDDNSADSGGSVTTASLGKVAPVRQWTGPASESRIP